MAECQAHIRALESVKQAKEHIMADSVHHAHRKALEASEEYHRWQAGQC